MNKTWIVAQREFNSRVKKKTFLLSTILLPLIIFGFYAFIIYFSVKGNDDLTIAVADKANVFNGKIDDNKDVQFVFVNDVSKESLEQKVKKGEYGGYILIPADYNILTAETISVFYSKTIGMISQERIERRINKLLEQKRLLAFNISQTQLDSARKSLNMEFKPISGEEKEKGGSKAGLSYAVGYASGFLIYIILFIYGTMVMRGVAEEKTNRIAEVIVSSVKPFQLMMGKIFGIGAVGLLQFIIWIGLGMAATALIPLLMQGGDASSVQNVPGAGAMVQASQNNPFAAVIGSINFTLLLPCFLFYFLGGYLLYSSLFAAVGSAVNEDPQDAQSLLLPVTMPIIFGIVIMTKAVNDPTSNLAVFGSLFPLTSPIVMMARIAHGIPNGVSAWELILSMVLLIAGFICTTWLAGKIYRTGILMYGKKPTWKEMLKWAMRKN